MKDFWTLQQAGEMHGINAALLNTWIRSGVIPLSMRAGRLRALDWRGLLCTGIAVSLRRKGMSMVTIRTVVSPLATMDENELKESLQSGRTLYVAFETEPPRLVLPDAIVINRMGHAGMLIAVDLKECAQRLANGIVARDKAAKAKQHAHN